MYKYKRNNHELSYIMNEKERNIINKNDIINKITEEIRLKEKEELIKKYESEIISLNNKLERTTSSLSNLNEYYNSEICYKILKQIEELSRNKMDNSLLEPLKQDELFLLVSCANKYLNNLLDDLSGRYPKLKKEDLYYLCLIIVNLNDKQIAALFGVTYNSIRARKKKICSLFNITTEEIHSFLNGLL